MHLCSCWTYIFCLMISLFIFSISNQTIFLSKISDACYFNGLFIETCHMVVFFGLIWRKLVSPVSIGLQIFRFNVAYPCKPLTIPENGAKVCNAWKKDYGEFCLAFCGPTYSLDIRYSHHQWYVCGASGQWIPKMALPNCTGNKYLISLSCLKTISKPKMFLKFLTDRSDM